MDRDIVPPVESSRQVGPAAWRLFARVSASPTAKERHLMERQSTESIVHLSSYDKWSLVACLLGTFFLRMASAVMGSTLQLYFGYIDSNVYALSDTMRGVALASFFLPELIGSPVFGAWSDRRGPKWFILLGSIFGGLGVQVTAMTTNYAALVLTRLLGGLSTASAIPATLSYLSALTARSESLRGRVMGLFEMATLAGTILGIIMGGRIWDLYHTGSFTLDALIYLLSLVIFMVGMRELSMRKSDFSPSKALERGRQALSGTFRHYLALFSTPSVLRFAPAFLAVNMILGIWMNHIVGQLVSPRDHFPGQLIHGLLANNGGAGTDISVYAALILGVFGLGVLIWSLLIGRWRRTTVMLISAAALFVLCGDVYALNHAPSLDQPLVAIYIGVALAALLVLSGMMPAALTFLADVTESRTDDRGAIMGLYTILFGFGGFLGTLIGGPFADWGAVDGILLATALLGAVAMLLLLRLHSIDVRSSTEA